MYFLNADPSGVVITCASLAPSEPVSQPAAISTALLPAVASPSLLAPLTQPVQAVPRLCHTSASS